MKTDKYYYPQTKEDFTIGLEYEMFNYSDSVYGTYICTFDDFYWPVVLGQIHDGKCRIKSLDREDIKDLGFEIKSENAQFIATSNSKFDLSYSPENKEVVISHNSKNGNYICFNGIIKNKSVLKNILQMVDF